MLACRAPFVGVTRMDTMVAILEREPALLFQFANNAPPCLSELQRVISKALCKERDKRYRTAAEMLVDLKGARQQLEQTGAQVMDDSMRSARMCQGHEYAPSPSRYETTKARSYSYGLQVLSVAALIAVMMVTAFLYRRLRVRANAAAPAAVASGKPYTQMSSGEQLAFVDEQEQRISAMMGDRPMKLN